MRRSQHSEAAQTHVIPGSTEQCSGLTTESMANRDQLPERPISEYMDRTAFGWNSAHA
jgi:hypothetical protein